MRQLGIYLLLALALLTACGGGSDSKSVEVNKSPSVSAGSDQIVLGSTTVNLNGTASDIDGIIASYSWIQTSGDSVALSSSNSDSASFVMPESPLDSNFSFTLSVTDNEGKTASDTVTITYHQAPTVDAGENQTVLISSAVNLIGTATSNDGSIATFSWVQISGETVSLSNSDSSSTTFTAPNSAGQLVFRLTATDNLGFESKDNVVVNITSSSANVLGKVTFDLVPFNTSTNGLDYANTSASPARGVLVETVDTSGNILQSTATDSSGNFTLNANPGTTMRIRVSAHLLQTNGAKWDVRVTDNTNGNAPYVTQGALFVSSEANTERNIHLASGWDGTSYSQTRSAGPFAILDAIYDTMQKFAAVNPSIDFPSLEVRWSPNNSTASGKLEEGDIATSFYSNGEIYILGKEDEDTDEYDRHIIIHEWGHYFEDKLSRADSIGGPHSLSDRLDFRVAFGEGWGNAISAMVTDDIFYRDSFESQQSQGWWSNINNNNTTNAGWFNEGSVQSILYDIYDDDSEARDNIALGLGPIYSVLTDTDYRNQPYFTSIYTFINKLKSQQPQSANAIDSLLINQNIGGTGDDGLNETNDGNIPSALPVYKSIIVGGAPIQVCSVNDAGNLNKLGNRVFITFQITSSGSYTFTATESGAATQSDPEILIFHNGRYILNSTVEKVGQETITTNLSSTDTYQMEIYDWNNADDTANAGNYCFDVQISN